MEMRDIGWFEDRDIDNVADSSDQCLGSDLRPSVIIGGTDAGVKSLALYHRLHYHRPGE
jgi:hypothetical protein